MSTVARGVRTRELPPGGAVRFYADMWSRNEDILDRREQATLQSIRVLVAGCGTVGGSVVEPLARMGVCSFVLADPEVYEVSNLNRQACTVETVGRPKVEVLADVVRSINPLASVTTLGEGLTPENLPAALEDVAIVFEGVDAFASLWVKYLVHEEAAERRIPVLSGVDLGGQPTVYVWDYRRDRRPFYGRATEADHREGRAVEALAWLGYRSLPADFLPVIQDRMASGRPWPQVAYCSDALGAIGARAIVDVLLGRPVRDVVAADLHVLTRPLRGRVAARAAWPRAIAATLMEVKRGARRPPPAPGPEESLSDGVRTALRAIRVAPSIHNVQPWRVVVTGESLRLDWDRSRALHVTDPSGRAACYSLGCAIEAAASIASVEHEPGPAADPLDRSWNAGVLRVDGVDERGYPRAQGLLERRGTSRFRFLADPVEGPVLDRLAARAAAHGAELLTLTGRGGIDAFARLTETTTAVALRDERELDELMRWIRTSRRELARSPDGFTAATLAIDPGTAALLGTLKRNATLRRLASRAGLADAMAKQAGALASACGALVAIAHRDTASHGCLAAGRAMMAVWLEATRANLSFQPVNQALVAERGTAEVRDLFGAARDDCFVAVVRLGRAALPPPRSPRRPVAEMCTVVPSVAREATNGGGGP